MVWDHQGFQDRIVDAIDAYDAPAVGGMVDELIEYLRFTNDVYPEDAAKRILQLLRRKRFFAEMERAADAFFYGGQNAPRVRSLHAQSLLDQGKLTVGIDLLKELDADTEDDPEENAEARGLLGRAYKQVYMDVGSSATERSQENLRMAVMWYYGVYSDDNEKIWHGINTVAVLKRGVRDGVDLAGCPDPEVLADAILTEVKNRRADQKADAWDYATAAEACLALGKYDESLEWVRRYVDGSDADAFELASTLRQFEEVWGLIATEEPGRRLLPYLRAELLQREGGRVDLDAGTGDFEALAELARDEDGTYEAVLGTESFKNVKWLHTALTRARSIARIDDQMEEPQGTAFVVRPEDLGLQPTEDGELLLLTSSHVISRIPSQTDALQPDEAAINFEIDSLGTPLTVKSVATESGMDDLDFILFSTDVSLADRDPIPVAHAVPILGERVYIIGHPEGGRLRFSIYDNRLLNHVSPHLHYRAPTKGGSSGSPVMNKNWQLIGLHHLGKKMVRVPKQATKQAANEGIAIEDIRKHIEQG